MIETHRLKNVVIFIQTILSFVLSRKIIFANNCPARAQISRSSNGLLLYLISKSLFNKRGEQRVVIWNFTTRDYRNVRLGKKKIRTIKELISFLNKKNFLNTFQFLVGIAKENYFSKGRPEDVPKRRPTGDSI